MPEIGEVRTNNELGLTGRALRHFTPCPICGEARWVSTTNIHKGLLRCKRCCDNLRSERYIQEVAKRFGGRVKRASELGYVATRALYVELPCKRCGTLRWLQASHPKDLCNKCAADDRAKNYRGNQNSRWAGGKITTKQGYVQVRVYPADPLYPLAGKLNHRVFEHRLGLARYLGRCLENWELVHHKGTRYPMDSYEDRQDNRWENLEVVPNNVSNIAYTKMESRIRELEKQVKLLKWQIKTLQHGNPDPSLSKEYKSRQEGVETKAERTQLNNAY